MTYTMSDTDPAYQGFLSDSSVTIAEVLQAAGCRTLMSGKWHVARQRSMAERDRWPDDPPATVRSGEKRGRAGTGQAAAGVS